MAATIVANRTPSRGSPNCGTHSPSASESLIANAEATSTPRTAPTANRAAASISTTATPSSA